MTPSFRSIAAALAGLGLAGMMTMCHAQPGVRRGEDASVHALLRAVSRGASDPDAGTYWLRQEETVTVHADGTSQEDYHSTGRILTDQGLDDGDVSIPCDTSSQSVTGVQARTIRPDGTVLRVQPSDIHATSPYSDFTLYDDAKNVGFSLPGVEPGSIIDYQYSIKTRTPIRRGQFSEGWWLASDDPCRLNRFTLILPKSIPIRYQLHNGAHIQFTQRLSSDGKTRTLRWVNRNTPDITPEPLMPPDETYLPWVEVSTWPNWQSIAQWYQDLAGPRMAATPALAALAHRLTAGKTTERAKAEALFYWVEQRTRYVAIEGGLSAYQPHAAAAVYQNRYGDCKDMATLLITLLHASGVPTAWPALLDTDLKTPLHDHLAVPDTFDHVIVRAALDGQPYWFDATAELATFGDIPGSDRGVEAFVVRNGRGDFETIPRGGPETNRTVYQKTVVLHEDGSAECHTTVEGSGDSAVATREQFHALRRDQWADEFQKMLSDQASAKLERYSLSSCSDPGTPLTYGAAYRAPVWAIRTGGLLIVSDGLTFTTPTDERTRRHPLSLDNTEQIDYTATVTLPVGDTVEAQPEDFDERTPLGEVQVTYRSSPGRLIIHKVFTETPGTVSAAAFPQLVASWDRIAEYLKQPVVLHPMSSATPIVAVAKS